MTRRRSLKDAAKDWDLVTRLDHTDADNADDAVDVVPSSALVTFEPAATDIATVYDPDADNETLRAFDYSLLTMRARSTLVESEHRLDEIERRSIIAKGRELRTIRDTIRAELGHGHWLAWLKNRRTTPTTANARIRAATWADESAIVAVLGAAALYRAAGAPDEVKQEVLRRLDVGEKVALAQVKELVEQHKIAKAEAARLRKMSPEQREEDEKKRLRKEKRDRRAQEKQEQEGEERRGRRLAATEDLISKLRTKFDDDDIMYLAKKWIQAPLNEIVRILRESGSNVESLVTFR